MIRVLVISHYLWPEEFRINQVLADLAGRGVEITALTGQPNYPQGTVFAGYRALSTGSERHADGYDIVRVPVVPRGRGGGIRLALNYLSFVAAGILLGPILLRKRKIDVVFVYGTTPAIQGFVANWLGWWKRARVVHWVQDLWPHALSATGHVRSPAVLNAVDRVVRLMYRQSDLVLGQSRAFVQFLKAQAHPTPVAYFPNPGEPPDGAVDPLPVPMPSGFNIVFAGNLGRAQSLDTVVAAAALLRDIPDLRIILYGSGAVADDIEQAAARLGLSNVLLPGRVSPGQIRSAYAGASALLLTLVNDPVLARTVPSKLQSYLAAGKPVIAAISGEAADIVAQSGGGLACPAENPEALADAIRRLHDMAPAERTAMGTAGRRYFDAHYHPDLLADRLLAGLSQVAEGGRADAFERGELT